MTSIEMQEFISKHDIDDDQSTEYNKIVLKIQMEFESKVGIHDFGLQLMQCSSAFNVSAFIILDNALCVCRALHKYNELGNPNQRWLKEIELYAKRFKEKSQKGKVGANPQNQAEAKQVCQGDSKVSGQQ